MKVDLYDDDIGFVELVDHMGSDLSVVNSARVSFGKHKNAIDEKDEKLINYLIQHKHTSTLEHCTVTFRFKVPMFVSKQHMRHRTWSYNEISRRYTDANIEFYEPKMFRMQHTSNRQASTEVLVNPLVKADSVSGGNRIDYLVRSHHRNSLRLYNELIINNVCREQARGVLPQNTYTEYYGTANLNNIMKFVELRSHDGAQWEIQRVARAVVDITQDLFPITTKAFIERRNTDK